MNNTKRLEIWIKGQITRSENSEKLNPNNGYIVGKLVAYRKCLGKIEELTRA